MELKVACDCGQKYKFDVEPVGGQMPFTVNCPVCGVDGTPAANQLLAQQFPLVPAAPAPAPVAEPAAPTPGGLRINRPAPAAAPPPLFASSAAAPTALPGVAPLSQARPLKKAPAGAPKEFSMPLGALGAFLGSAVGGALIYGFYLWAHFRMPLTGTIIGVLSGLGARTLARGTDTVLGIIAAAFALASIVGVFFLIYGDLFIAGFILGIFSIVICISFAYRIASG